MRYTAVIIDENGADQGPVNVSGAQDDDDHSAADELLVHLAKRPPQPKQKK